MLSLNECKAASGSVISLATVTTPLKKNYDTSLTTLKNEEALAIKNFTNNSKTQKKDLTRPEIDQSEENIKKFLTLVDSTLRTLKDLGSKAEKNLAAAWATEQKSLKTSVDAVNTLVASPKVGGGLLSKGNLIPDAVKKLLANAEKRITQLVDAANNGDIKKGLVVPGMLTKNPLGTPKAVTRKKIPAHDALDKTIQTKISALFNNIATEDAGGKKPYTSASLKSFEVKVKNGISKLSTKKIVAKGTTLAQMKAAYTASIEITRRAINDTIDGWYNDIVTQLEKALKTLDGIGKGGVLAKTFDQALTKIVDGYKTDSSKKITDAEAKLLTYHDKALAIIQDAEAKKEEVLQAEKDAAEAKRIEDETVANAAEAADVSDDDDDMSPKTTKDDDSDGGLSDDEAAEVEE